MVIIKTPPPIYEISKLRVKGAIQVYALLFESAFKDTRYDKRSYLDWKDRRDAGGTTYWSIKAMAQVLMLGKATVLKAIDALLENGFISVEGYLSSKKISKQRIFRVTTIEQLEARRSALSFIGVPRLEHRMNNEDTGCNIDFKFLEFLENYTETPTTPNEY
tara:strand:+ start:145 stop:630 length:486 start_codon:yes stop_codon:yes gene_type:complete